jgi:hypothetical protein
MFDVFWAVARIEAVEASLSPWQRAPRQLLREALNSWVEWVGNKVNDGAGPKKLSAIEEALGLKDVSASKESRIGLNKLWGHWEMEEKVWRPGRWGTTKARR